MVRLILIIRIIFILLTLSLVNLSIASASKDSNQISTQIQAKNDFSEIAKKIIPSVVNIDGQASESPKFIRSVDQVFGQQEKYLSSVGSGFILSQDGYIITNHHVIEGSKEITVTLYNKEKYLARLIGFDKKTDLALLKIDADYSLAAAKIGDSDLVKIGNWAIIVGNPYGFGQSLSVGVVSAIGRNFTNGQIEEFIQTDASINSGNSGGPMFNDQGEVIGVNAVIFSPNGGSIGIGFATPINIVKNVAKQLKENGYVTRGWIGVIVRDLTADIAQAMNVENIKGGAFVNDVIKDSPAKDSGIMPSDIIIQINDQKITEMKMVPKIISNHPIYENVNIKLLRKGQEIDLELVVAQMPEKNYFDEITEALEIEPLDSEFNFLGLGVRQIDDKTAKMLKKEHQITTSGLLVNLVESNSPGYRKGVQVGDIITLVNQEKVSSIKDLTQIIDQVRLRGSKKLFLMLKRGSSNYPLTLDLSNED